MCSDGATPEEQVKQILTIAPILTGVRRNSRYDIPPHHPHAHDSIPEESIEDTRVHTPSKSRPATAGSQGSRIPLGSSDLDLVDFGSKVDIRGCGLEPALVPTSKGLAVAGCAESSGLDGVQSLKSSLPAIPVPNGRSSPKGLQRKGAGSGSLKEDGDYDDDDRFEDAAEN